MNDEIRILIVDDDRLVVKSILEGVDWERIRIRPYTAYSGDEARERIAQYAIQAMLCDIEMPGENGIRLLEWVRTHHAYLECIYLTNHDDFKYAQRAIKLGCFDYLLKPVHFHEIEDVLLAVADQIKQKKNERQLMQYGTEWMGHELQEVKDKHKRSLSPEEVVGEVQSYILKHLSEELSVDFLAKLHYISADYLTRIFKKYGGVTVSEYIVNSRIALAAKLLKETQLPAGDIAQSVGYLSYDTFSKMFKKIHGVRPTQYRNQELQTHLI